MLEKEYKNLDSFVIYMCVEGVVNIKTNNTVNSLITGETLLIPAIIKKVKIESNNAVLLEIYI
jgi:mannose-6-phosphate isomerase